MKNNNNTNNNRQNKRVKTNKGKIALRIASTTEFCLLFLVYQDQLTLIVAVLRVVMQLGRFLTPLENSNHETETYIRLGVEFSTDSCVKGRKLVQRLIVDDNKRIVINSVAQRLDIFVIIQQQLNIPAEESNILPDHHAD